jgi:hypothetical protein
MGFKYKFSKSKAREYAEKMDSVQSFCDDNCIQYAVSLDSFYFTLHGQKYRVSNHRIPANSYHHPTGYQDDVIYITAGKTRIEQIYTDLKNGKQLNKRGEVISCQ